MNECSFDGDLPQGFIDEFHTHMVRLTLAKNLDPEICELFAAVAECSLRSTWAMWCLTRDATY